MLLLNMCHIQNNAIFKYPLHSIKISPTIMEISNLDLDNYTG